MMTRKMDEIPMKCYYDWTGNYESCVSGTHVERK